MKPGNKSVTTGLKRILRKYEEDVGCEPQSALRDLLIDLRHLSDELGLDFIAAVDGSYAGYLEERAGTKE